ncbi:Scr1 family TA system antitoxin-like transcriptional regulator [Streptomyces sp. NPDC059913]|uniref:helix-turn-helix domain-containing protein n=1 Tax=unclassified Streptomyces TaxID=2593676 RepID=UPI00364B68C4
MKMVGRLMAFYRDRIDVTQVQLAEMTGHHPETISSIEQGRRVLLRSLAVKVDEVLGTGGALAVAIEELPEIDLIPQWADEYLELELDALTLSWYDNQVMPGLLQTPRYAEALFRNRIPTFSEAEVAFQTETRLKRQEILHRPSPPTLSFVVWEPVLSLQLTDEEAHAEQLRHLLECADLPGVCLQVLPLSHRTHAGLAGPFILLETPDFQRLAYSETQRGSLLVSDPDEISILSQKYAMLRTQALTPEDTRRLLKRLLGEQ